MPSNVHQFPEKSNQDDSDNDLDLVTLYQPLQGLTSSEPPAPVPQPPQPTILPPALPGGSRQALPDVGTAPTPQYSLCPWDNSGHVIRTLEMTENGSLSHIMIHMFQDVPNSFWEAMNSLEVDNWHQASEEEFEGLTEVGIWKLVPRPTDHKMVKCGWTYVLKSDGQYKAWLVNTQVQGIDYEETFSPVARYKSIRHLLPHAALLDSEIKAMDVKLAYLHGVLEEEIYMEQLEGFIAKGNEDKVCKLVCSLYGLKQAGWVWNRTFSNTIKRKFGFKMIHSDAGVYYITNRG